MGLGDFFWGRRRREDEARERELARLGAGENRIALISAAGGSGSDFLSDSQSGEIHRIFEREGQAQIEASPIVRRLLNRELSLRVVAVLQVEGEHFLGAHFVLDERTRHVYRVLVSPRCCLVERLWGDGLDEVRERPLAGALISWCDRDDQAARASLELIHSLVLGSSGWGLRLASLRTEPSSDIERRLFVGAPGAVIHHTRRGSNTGEGAIEIEWQGRILLIAPQARAGRKAELRVTGEVGALPF